MRAANDGSGTTVTTGDGLSTRAGSSGAASSAIGVFSTGAATLRARGRVFRTGDFLPFAVVDRFFVATTVAYHFVSVTARAIPGR